MAAAAAAPQVAAAAPEATPVASTSTASDADAFIAEAVQSTDDAGKKRERSPPTGEEPVTKKVKFEQPVAPTETAPEEVKRCVCDACRQMKGCLADDVDVQGSGELDSVCH